MWGNTEKLSAFLGRADEFDALYYPGGHGPAFDLAFDKDSHALVAEFVAKGKVVFAVCHGVAALTEVVLPDGSLLLAGKLATGYSNEEEVQAQMTEHVPFLIEDRLNKITDSYSKAVEPWWPNVVVDGKIITARILPALLPLRRLLSGLLAISDLKSVQYCLTVECVYAWAFWWSGIRTYRIERTSVSSIAFSLVELLYIVAD